MDSKDVYSSSVDSQNELAQHDTDLMEKIMQGKKRNIAHSEEWASVNINDIIDQFAPDAHAEVRGNKVEWHNEKTKISVVADIGGGYLRLQDKSVPYNLYLDKHGKDVRNYIDANGKQHGRPKTEREVLTHFRIKYRSEM